MSATTDHPAPPSPAAGRPALRIAVCLKWVDHRPDVDTLRAIVHTDARSCGPSDADDAALETALVLADAWRGTHDVTVVAVTAGGTDTEPMLRAAVAAGADRAERVALGTDAPSAEVAAALAPLVAEADLVVCGAWSLDRGSGAVPAFVAAGRRAAQALGLVAVTAGEPGVVTAERRLDGGRRERLAVRAPAVLSVEAGTARLRRASLDGVRAASRVVVASRPAPPGQDPPADRPRVGPYRPRAIALPAPRAPDARSRVLELTGATVERSPARVLTVDPEEGADAVVEQLRVWGYLPR